MRKKGMNFITLLGLLKLKSIVRREISYLNLTREQPNVIKDERIIVPVNRSVFFPSVVRCVNSRSIQEYEKSVIKIKCSTAVQASGNSMLLLRLLPVKRFFAVFLSLLSRSFSLFCLFQIIKVLLLSPRRERNNNRCEILPSNYRL